jgi:hypothetical protein
LPELTSTPRRKLAIALLTAFLSSALLAATFLSATATLLCALLALPLPPAGFLFALTTRSLLTLLAATLILFTIWHDSSLPLLEMLAA